MSETMTRRPLARPYPQKSCANRSCLALLDESSSAYLIRDARQQTLLILCGDCAHSAARRHPERFMFL